MIGIKVKNSDWARALANLLKEKAEIYQAGKKYSVLLTDTLPRKKDGVYVGLNVPQLKYNIPLPLKKATLESVLATIPDCYENDTFLWDSVHRQLHHKTRKTTLHLTQKEAELINFLIQQPERKATKEELLQKVWGYTQETDTHTVETTIHTLRQKLNKDASLLFISTTKGYQLV